MKTREPLFTTVHYELASPHPCGIVTLSRNAGHSPPTSARLSEVTCYHCATWLKKHPGAWNAARAADHVAGTAAPIVGGAP